MINKQLISILKINSGKVELRKDNGALIRKIGDGDAVNADIIIDSSPILVTTVKGKVEWRKENSALVRTIGNATNAIFSESDIVVLTNIGKTEMRKESGSLIRVI